MKSNLSSAIYRTSFYIAVVISIIATLLSALFIIASIELKLKVSIRDALILVAVLTAMYISIKFFLDKKLSKEGMMLVEVQGNNATKVKPGIKYSWGFIWRWYVVATICETIADQLLSPVGTSEKYSSLDQLPLYLIAQFVGFFFAAVWLLQQPYGGQRIASLSEDEWQIVEENNSNKGGGIFSIFSSLAGGAFGILAIGLYILFGVGGLYWLWMSIQLGSFFMFVVGIIPPFFVLTSIVGGYSLIFGLPDWVYSWFG